MKKLKILILVISCIVCLAISFLSVIPNMKRQNALKLIDEGKIEEAYSILSQLGDYKDSKELLDNFKWVLCKTVGEYGTETYEYSEFGDCIRENYKRESGYEYSYEYIYDGDGKCIKRMRTDSDGKTFVDEYSYIYDERGNCVTESEKSVNGNKLITDYRYDDEGNLIEEVSTYVYVSSGEINTDTMSTHYYEYDEKGRCVKEYGYAYRDGWSVEHQYSEDGKRIKTVGLYDGTDVSDYETQYSYDDNGNCIREETRTLMWHTPNVSEKGTADHDSHTSITEYEYRIIYAKQRSEN